MATEHDSRIRRTWERLLTIGAHPEENSEQRGRRRIMVGFLVFSVPGIGIPAVLAKGGWLTVIALVQAGVHLGGLLLLRRYPAVFAPMIHVVVATDITSDTTQTILMGGLLDSGLQIIWSLPAMLAALIAFRPRVAGLWFAVFVVAVTVTAGASSMIDTPVYPVEGADFDAAFALSGASLLVIAVIAYFVRQRDRFQRQSDDLLHNILPDEIAERLKNDSEMIAEQFDEVTVLFADVVDFTPMSAHMSPTELVGLLDDVFTDLDDFVDELGLEKIKTVGDEYMVAAGVPTPRTDHAEVMADLALRIRDHVANHDYSGHRIVFRIGLNSGPVVAGIIGRRKFAYDLWGDVVNTASRMESHGVAGEIQISRSTHKRISSAFECEPRGLIEVKGKGTQEAWLLKARTTIVAR